MELPRPLAPWAAQLDLFPRELAGALGPLVQAIDRLVGPPRVRPESGRGEPDGFDGLLTRGPYERLLLTEWLLATEAPDEFARRAAMHEHAFYRLVHKTPSGGRLSVALFDAGPEQWGSPRIAQLAILVVLARRAEAAGLRFVWGVAQSAPGASTLCTQVTPDTVKRLLLARSTRAATDEDIQGWRELFRATATKGETVDDGWLIGSRLFGALPTAKGLSLLTIEDVYEPDPPRRVSLTVRAANGDAYTGRASAVLALPEDRLAVRLIRDPFESTTTTPVRASRGIFVPTSNLIFGQGGTKLFARNADGDLISFPLPNSPRASAGLPKRFRTQPGTTLLAAGRVRKMQVTVSRTQTGNLWVSGVGGGWWNLQGEYEHTTPDHGLTPPLGPCYGLPNGDLIALLPGGELVRFSQTEGKRTVVGTRGVQTIATSTYGAAFVSASASHYLLHLHRTTMPPEVDIELTPLNGAPAQAFFVPSGKPAQYSIVVRQGTGWSVFLMDWNTAKVEWAGNIKTPSGASIMGFADSGPEPIVLEADRRTISYPVEQRSETIVFASGEVEYSSLSGTASLDLPMLAYATKTGEVHVYSLNHKEYLFRFLPESEKAEPAQGTLPLLEIPQRDERTGLLTKHAIRERLGALKPPYTVMLFTLEGYTAYSENAGKVAGDTTLKEIGQYLQTWTEGTGRLAARTGAEEFLLALPHEVQSQAAVTYAATLRRQIMERCLKETKIDLSLGLARCPQNGATLEAVLHTVNEALTQARQKTEGVRIHVA